jgi:hypothetical protein
MKLRKRPSPNHRGRSYYLMMFDRRDADARGCRWVSLGGEPWNTNTDTILVEEGEIVPPR